MKTFFVLSVLGSTKVSQSTVLGELFKTIKEYECNVEDGRMSNLGSEFALYLLISGNWDAIAKIENLQPRLEKNLQVTITSRRAEPRLSTAQMMPYAVEVVSINRPGVVYDISQFFNSRDICIEDMYTNTYQASYTDTDMFSLHITVSIPTEVSIATLRGEFMEFCDQLNIDSIMEPVK